jgi:uncharacterized protein (TIGR02001 family)
LRCGTVEAFAGRRGVTLSAAVGRRVGASGQRLVLLVGQLLALSRRRIDAINPDNIEVDLSAGFSKSIDSLTSDVGVVAYLYPGTNIRVWEGYASVENDFGPAAVKLGVFYAPNQKDTRHSTYLYGDASAPVPGAPITVRGHVGYSDGGLAVALGQNHYVDYSVGADVTVGKVIFNLSYIATDFKTKFEEAESRFVLTVSTAF